MFFFLYHTRILCAELTYTVDPCLCTQF